MNRNLPQIYRSLVQQPRILQNMFSLVRSMYVSKEWRPLLRTNTYPTGFFLFIRALNLQPQDNDRLATFHHNFLVSLQDFQLLQTH